jgi:hypothetical protein
MILKEIPNGGKENVEAIRYVHEQQFFLLLRNKLPEAKIIYEESTFEMRDEDGTVKAVTSPDFFIKLGENRRNIVEITTASKAEDLLKQKQNKKSKNDKIEMMKLRGPNDKYTVLFREHLLKIQKHNPWVDFLGAKKIRENECQAMMEIME